MKDKSLKELQTLMPELATKQLGIIQNFLNAAKKGNIDQITALNIISELADVNGDIMQCYNHISDWIYYEIHSLNNAVPEPQDA